MKRKVLAYTSIFIAIMLFLGISLSLSAENGESESYFQTPPQIRHLSNKSIEVSWNQYPDADFSTHYQVLLNHAYYGTSTKGLEQTCNYITPGSKVDVRVVTFHKGHVYNTSSPASILMAPAAPSAMTFSEVDTESFKITWSGVESATSYNIYNNGTKIGSKAESGLDNQLRLTGFPKGSLLNIAMTAINSTGESPKSQVTKVQLLPVASMSVFIPNKSITSKSFKVKWTKQAYATGYRILINDTSVATVTADITEYEVTDLEPGTTVSLKVGVINPAGEATIPEPVIVQLKPDAPMVVTRDISSYSCTLTWSVANGANNYKIFENGDNAIYNLPSTITNVTITEGVIPGSTVIYKVRGVNDIGESEDSNIVEVTYTSREERGIASLNSIPQPASRIISSSINIPNPNIKKINLGNYVIAVYFPQELNGPELELEVEYLSMLASIKELESIKFYGIFTNHFPKGISSRDNIKWIRAKKKAEVIIPGKLPIVRFYSDTGVLRTEIMISIPIMTTTEVYKAFPELLEQKSSVLNLYREEDD